MTFLEQFGKIIPVPSMLPKTTSEMPAYLANLDQSINETYDKVSELLCELGAAYYERHKDDRNTEFEDQLEVIRAAYTEIENYQKLADEVEERKRCSTCGAELMEGSVFCSICGTKIPESTSEPEDQKVCPQCHAVVDSDDAFCSICGTDLRNKNTREVS